MEPPALTARSEFGERSYLFTPEEGMLIMCILVNPDEKKVLCAESVDLGRSWSRLDELVSNVVYYRKDKRALYALAQDRYTPMRSMDLGVTWRTISDAEYTGAINDAPFGELVNATKLPFDEGYVEPGMVVAPHTWLFQGKAFSSAFSFVGQNFLTFFI